MAHTPPGQTRERIFRFVRDRLLDGRPPTVRKLAINSVFVPWSRLVLI